MQKSPGEASGLERLREPPRVAALEFNRCHTCGVTIAVPVSCMNDLSTRNFCDGHKLLQTFSIAFLGWSDYWNDEEQTRALSFRVVQSLNFETQETYLD